MPDKPTALYMTRLYYLKLNAKLVSPLLCDTCVEIKYLLIVGLGRDLSQGTTFFRQYLTLYTTITLIRPHSREFILIVLPYFTPLWRWEV